MTPEQIYDQSYWRCMRNDVAGVGFFLTFYDHLFEQSPDIKAHFANTDMRRQRKMLRDSFTLISEHHFKKDTTELIRLRDLHANRQIPARLYSDWLDALVDSVRVHDPDFDHEVEFAWRAVFSTGIRVMTGSPE